MKIKQVTNFFSALGRKKRNDGEGSSPLARVLTLVDLTALGVGSTLGLGVYVLAGSVAKTVAGPAVCISFLVAAVASAVAGTASVARGMSSYLDALVDKKIKNQLTEWMPIDISFLSPYPDFLSFIFVMVLTGLLAFGVKESSSFNNFFTIINLVTICIAIVAGSINADVKNWQIDTNTLSPADKEVAGAGGFIPFGVAGIMAGAAKCFYGFVGFDAVATTGEEAKNPQRDIPLAIVISLSIIFGAYFAISTVLTMTWPYYLQDAEAPFPYVFDQIGWTAIKWIVTIGAIFALCTSMLGAMFPLPRVIYAMANDGVIYKVLSKVDSRTQTPIIATVLSGLFSGIMAILFDLDQLIDMMSIGTLMAYTIVAVSVLLLRYQPIEKSKYPGLEMNEKIESIENYMMKNLKNLFNLHNIKYPTKESSIIVNWSIALFSIFTALFCATVANGRKLVFTEPLYILAFIITIIGMAVLMVIMIRQPVADEKLSFKVPLVPYVPCLSVVFNLYLMFELDLNTWIRFLAWLAIGFVIYFTYGIQHSEEGRCIKEKREGKGAQEKEVTTF
ncbi:cationic amino acid transporter 2-like isoform X4 [Diorhabda carinulata]|nr:cationic amino acid transporter 2-like isoform X4 [Diorhabda carinulata]XP_057668074.1 cationic amino acid transporter 2-like isoform X4 [Diorhabda carinulata]XP_057668075.1 cationic amino acid transporter 2-like isoform X4 [Diorhabda carinulata]